MVDVTLLICMTHYGDGWNGNVFSITDNVTGNTVSAGLATGSDSRYS